MKVLVTNDDGIHAPGLAALASAAERFGDVYILAPVSEQSGVGHGVTLSHPLRTSTAERNGGFSGHAVSGTPADCVKLAVTGSVVPCPDVILSGVNAGRNTGIHLLYSGTVAAAIEGAILGVPSVASSVDFSDAPDFQEAGASPPPWPSLTVRFRASFPVVPGFRSTAAICPPTKTFPTRRSSVMRT